MLFFHVFVFVYSYAYVLLCENRVNTRTHSGTLEYIKIEILEYLYYLEIILRICCSSHFYDFVISNGYIVHNKT